MNKLKALLAVVLACVLALSLASCAPGGCSPADVIVPESLSVNTAGAKTVYTVGEDYTSEGLVVTLSEFNQTKDTSAGKRDIALTDSNLTIDSSAYNKNAAGTYTIKLGYTAADTTVETSYTVKVNEPPVTETLQSISLNTAKATTHFYYGDEFTSDGLVVTASILRSDSATPVERDVTADAVVDYEEYNNAEKGTYTITVSYTLGSVTKSAEYNVDVAAKGVDVRLKEGYADVINLSAQNKTADLSGYAQMVEVRRPEANGTVDLESAPMNPEDYTVELYVNDELVGADKAAALGSGAYQIWVTLDEAHASGYEFEAFVIIYVVDAVQSLSFNAEAAGTLTSQEEGADSISATWTFTAAYASGATKPLTAEDVEIAGLDTKTPTEAGVAMVSYTDTDVTGAQKTVQTTVAYTITEKPSAPGQTNTYSLSIPELAAAVGGTDTTQDSKLALTQESFDTASNSFLTLSNPGSSDVYRSKYECIELKDGILSVTFEGTGTLSVAVRSTSDKNISDIGVKGPDGKWVAATYEETTNIGVLADGYYTVTGKSFITLTFEITAAGTYSIESNISGQNGRPVRINAITMVDTVGGSAVTPAYEDTIIKVGDITGVTFNNTATTADVVGVDNEGVKITFTAKGKFKPDTAEYEGATYTNCFNTAGGLKADSKSIKIELKAGATVTVICKAAGDGARNFNFYASDAKTALTTNADVNDKSTVFAYSYTAESAGTYYAGANTGGFNVFAIIVEFN